MDKRKRILIIYQWAAAVLAAAGALLLGGLVPGVYPPEINGIVMCAAAGVLLVGWVVLALLAGALAPLALLPAAGKALLAAALYAVVLNAQLPMLAHPVRFLGCCLLFLLSALWFILGAPKVVGALGLTAALALVLVQPLQVQAPREEGGGDVTVTLTAIADTENPPAERLQVSDVQAYEASVPPPAIKLDEFVPTASGWQTGADGASLRYTAGAQWYTHVVFANAPAGWHVELSSGNLGVQHTFTGQEEVPFTLSWYTEPAVNWTYTLLGAVPLAALLGFGLVFLGSIRSGGLAAAQKAAEGKKRGKLAGLFYYLVAALPPMVFLFYIYHANFDYLSFLQVGVVALALGALSAGLQFLLGRLLLKSPGAACLSLLLFWVLFFTFNQIYVALEAVCLGLRIETFTAMVVLAGAMLTVLLVSLGRRLGRPEAYAVLAVMLVAVLMMNLGPVTWYQITAPKYNPDHYKTEFEVDAAAPSPNIYWFHIDGMLSFAGVEELFDDAQDEFIAELEERGFVLNRDAWFESGHTTTVAVLEMMSPSFYEAEILPMLDFEGFGDEVAYDAMVAKLRDPSLKNQLNMAHVNNETLAAFRQKGYYTAAITYSDLTIYKTVDTFYSMADVDLDTPVLTPKSDAPGRQFLSGIDRANLVNVLTEATALRLLKPQMDGLVQAMNGGHYDYAELTYPVEDARAIIGEGYEKAGEVMVRALGEILQSPAPRFAVVHDVQAHTPYIYDEEGNRVPGQGGAEYGNYHAQHVYARTVLVQLLDMILEADPGAVIVLQSDHGLHGTPKADLAAAGLSLDEIQLAWNGAVSAVRIPDSYGGLDAPLDPLNTSRELVNRFVGENYVLLPEDQANQRPRH